MVVCTHGWTRSFSGTSNLPAPAHIIRMIDRLISVIKRIRTEHRWTRLDSALRVWANREMDQFDKFKFVDHFGHTVYVTISYYDDYPNSFEDLDNPFRWPPPETVTPDVPSAEQ
jgi:hypothetical protein